MYIIEVIPLVRGSQIDSLTYYSSVAYPTGSVITVPIRSREVRGIVVSHQPVSSAKTAVRAATFTLKKLPEQTDIRPLPPIVIETAKQITKLVPANLGAVLFSLLPEEVRDGTHELESNLPCIGLYETPAISILQGTEEERFRSYRSHIREAFSHRGSVLVVVPTTVEVEHTAELLAQGIENRIVTFSSAHTAKKLARSYESFHDFSHAKLIITTPSHAFLDRHDITHIIIEQSRSPYYKGRTRPYLDTRESLKTLAKISGRQIIMGDLLPSTEDEYFRREDIYLTEGEHPKRIPFTSDFRIIKQTDKPKPDVPFELLSPKLIDAINDMRKRRRNSFLFAARRGIAPVVVCIDCGHIFRCPDSGTPYSLFRTMKNGEEQRWFLSGTSGQRLKAADVCPDCGGWRLKERGVGIQHIHDELKKIFPRAPIILFDHTTATTRKKAQNLIGEFYDQKGSLLLGTSMALPYIDSPIGLSAIISLDATRSIPSWRADEELFSLLLRLRERTTDTLYVQTRSEPDEILDYAKSGLVDQFYTDELELRSALKYPPAATFVHLTLSGLAAALTPLEDKLTELLTAWEPKFYSAPQSTANKTFRYCLFRIPADAWPDKKLLRILNSLPPSVRIEINPARVV